jgi:hypothetical protein
MDYWNSLVSDKRVTLHFELYGTHRGPWNILGEGNDLKYVNEFCAEWASFCELPQNKSLVPLKCVEGGLCTEEGVKEIRIDHCGYDKGDMYAVFKFGEWQLQEIVDLGTAFKKVMEHRMGTDVNDAKLLAAHKKLEELESAFFKQHPQATIDDLHADQTTIDAIDVRNRWQLTPGCGHVYVEVFVKV